MKPILIAVLAAFAVQACTWVKPTPARNEAPSLGGDTVVAEGDVIDGRQLFGVYACGS